MSSPIAVMRAGRSAAQATRGGYRLRPRYSRFVGMMKVVLPAARGRLARPAGGLAAPFAASASVPRSASRNASARIDTLSVRNPRYYGTDEKNLPFTITADVATQLDPSNIVVTLEKPVADLVRADGEGIVIDADIGFYRQHDDTLDLLGHVDLYRDDGYELHTASARILVGQRRRLGRPAGRRAKDRRAS